MKNLRQESSTAKSEKMNTKESEKADDSIF